MNTSIDTLDQVLGIRPGSHLDTLRDERPDVRRSTKESFDALFSRPSQGLSVLEREAAAFCVAVLENMPALADFHRARFLEAGGASSWPDDIAAGNPLPDARLTGILEHVVLLTRKPGAATRDHLAGLTRLGLTPPSIVTLAQIIAFMSYQIRVAHGLVLLGQPS
jgi:uncharacterized protein YciW